MSEIERHQHITPRGGEGWAVRTAGSERASKIFQTRVEAIDYARELAVKHKVCMVVHDEDGQFEEFECDPEFRNKHVRKDTEGWAVIAEGGEEVSQIFRTKGAAMAYAYDMATKHDVCTLVHGNDGKIQSKTCPPEGHPGILDVFRMKLKV